MEHWEALCPDGLRFVYDDTLFRPGTDTFLLSSLPRLKRGLRVCDLGCGTGLLSLLLLQRQPELQVTGVEILPQAAALARRAAEENHLSGRLTIVEGDLRSRTLPLTPGSFDLAVCNPPYYSPGSGALPGSERFAHRPHGSHLHPDGAVLCRGPDSPVGRPVLPGSTSPERLTDLLCAMREAALEPKRLRFVCSKPGAAPSLVLAEGCRGGRPGLTVEPPLLLRQADGSPTAELDAIYFRTQEDTL